MARRDVDRKQRRRRARPERQSQEHPRQRQRQPGRRMRFARVEVAAPCRDLRGETQPRPFALAGIGLEGDEVEIVLRRDLLEPRVEHRLEPIARQRESVDRGAERERDRASRRLRVALAARTTSRHQASRIAARLGSRARSGAWRIS